MRFAVYFPDNNQPQDHADSLNAFCKGVRGTVSHVPRARTFADGYDTDADVHVLFGVGKRMVPVSWPRGEIIEQARKDGKPFILLEKGFFKRDEYFHVGWNGLNGHANFYNDGMDDDRFRALNIPIKPYKEYGEIVLLCGQVPWDATVQNTDHKKWCQRTYTELEVHSSRPVVFRAHPLGPPVEEYGLEFATLSDKTMEEDFERAYAVVAYNSTTAALAILEGIHTFVGNDLSVAYPIANKDIRQINSPCPWPREQWAYDLAYAQWTLEELASGQCWDHLKRGLE